MQEQAYQKRTGLSAPRSLGMRINGEKPYSSKRCEEWWRVVKSGWPLFTSHNPDKHWGFRRICEEWRVKSRVRFLRVKPRFLQSESIFRMAMVDLPKSFSGRITLRPAMAKSCPNRGQYCAIVRQKVEWASFQLRIRGELIEVKEVITPYGRSEVKRQ